MSRAAVIAKSLNGRPETGGGYLCRCPLTTHGRRRGDRNPSLLVRDGDFGVIVHCFAGCDRGHVLEELQRRGLIEDLAKSSGRARPSGSSSRQSGRRELATYTYKDEHGHVLFQVVRYEPKDFRQRSPDGAGGWSWSLEGVRRVPYRLPELIETVANEHTVFVVEGEKDVETLQGIGITATCNPGGASKWRGEYSVHFGGADVVIIPDNDDPGRKHAESVAKSLCKFAARVRILELPGLPPAGDVSDWLAEGHTREELDALIEQSKPWASIDQQTVPHNSKDSAVSLEDFYAYMPMHLYIYAPSREMWPASSVNSRVPPVPLVDSNGRPILGKNDEQKAIPANAWLDRNKPVEMMTWAPGLPMLVRDRLISEGGWIERANVSWTGDSTKADRWLDHARLVFNDDVEHIVKWLAHRVQRPHEKINHALVLGGKQGIGKDTLVEPVKRAVGPWNFLEVSPTHLLGNFNGFLKSVILRINEARDLGDIDRFQFYDHMKAFTAAPPDVLRVNEKHLREYYVLNCCGPIITTNHKADGIFLPEDDRRHFVAWSDLDKDNFNPAYWHKLWRWYGEGGIGHVTAYLTEFDLSAFDPKAPPPKTPAFWDIVDAHRAPEDAELADLLDRMGRPDAAALGQITAAAEGDFGEWIRDRRNRRIIPHRLERCGYVPVRNDTAKDGFWNVFGRRQVIYAKATLSLRGRLVAASELG